MGSEIVEQRGGIVPLGGKMLSVVESPAEFAAIIAKSNDAGLVQSAIAEIRSRRRDLTPRVIVRYLGLFALNALLVLCLWPSQKPKVGEDTSDLTLRAANYESRDVLRTALHGAQWEEALLKLRTKLMEENTDAFMSEYRAYVDDIVKILSEKKDEHFKVRRCHIEAVLRSLNGAKTIGLRDYAMQLKTSGDPAWGNKLEDIRQAMMYCDEILMHDPKARNGQPREVFVNFQKAQLLMYRWLVENAKAARGKKVSSFPDDRGDRGVWAREQAIEIIREKAWNANAASDLVWRCVDILIDDSSLFNIIHFNGNSFTRHAGVYDEARKVLGGRR